MATSVIRKLFESFDELERSIVHAKRVLATRDPIPLSALRRVQEYNLMLAKQRKLAQELCREIHRQNWEEVGRLTRTIGSFSSLIYKDAMSLTHSIISSAGELEAH